MIPRCAIITHGQNDSDEHAELICGDKRAANVKFYLSLGLLAPDMIRQTAASSLCTSSSCRKVMFVARLCREQVDRGRLQRRKKTKKI